MKSSIRRISVIGCAYVFNPHDAGSNLQSVIFPTFDKKNSFVRNDRQTDRRTDRQTNRQTNRQTLSIV